MVTKVKDAKEGVDANGVLPVDLLHGHDVAGKVHLPRAVAGDGRVGEVADMGVALGERRVDFDEAPAAAVVQCGGGAAWHV